MFSSPATCGGRFGVRIVGPMFFLSTFGVDVHRGVHGVVCEVSSFTFKEIIREDVKPTHPLFWWRFGEASLKTPVLFCSSGGRWMWMWVSGSAFENAKRWRTMKTRLGFIALVVVACHCILIQRSNKAIRSQ